MAKESKYITDIRKLFFDGTAERGIYDRKEAMRMIYGGEVVFNRAKYTLNVPTEIEIDAVGSDGMPLWWLLGVESYKEDYNGNQTEIDYTGGDDIIGKNETEYNKSGSYEIVQDVSGLKISGTWTQKGKITEGYEFAEIWSVSPDYEGVGAGGGSVEPYVSVTVRLIKTLSDGSKENVYPTYRGSVSSASGNDDFPTYSTGASIESSGVVNVLSLGEYVTERRPVFNVTSLGGIVYVRETEEFHSWEWRGNVTVEQEENARHDYGTPDYVFSSRVDDTELDAVDTKITVRGTAIMKSYYYYDSNPYDIKETKTNEVLHVLLDGNVSDNRRLVGEDDVTVFDVGINSSTTQKRTFVVSVYYSDRWRYEKEFTVIQKESSYSEYWSAVSLNGLVVIENILASGKGQPVLVPIIQKKYGQVEGSTTDVLLDTFEDSVYAEAIGGTPVDGTGVSFSNGNISANTRGRNTGAERKVYTITSVSVYGKEGKLYTLPLPSEVEVKQDKNDRYDNLGSYILRVEATPSMGLPNIKGSSVISYTAKRNVTYTWDSEAEPLDDVVNVQATLQTDLGDFDGAQSVSVSGEGEKTLSIGENIREARKANVSIVSGIESADCEVWQDAVEYEFEAGDDKECNATESVVYVTFKSSRNGKAWEPTFSMDSTKGRIGNIAYSNFVYTVQVMVYANASTSMREVKVEARQTRYYGEEVLNVTITQDAAVIPSEKAKFEILECVFVNAARTEVRYSIRFDATDTTKYGGGTFNNVYVYLNTKENGSGNTFNDTSLGDVNVSRGGVKSFEGTLKANVSDTFFLVYFDGKIQEAVYPEMSEIL